MVCSSVELNLTTGLMALSDRHWPTLTALNILFGLQGGAVLGIEFSAHTREAKAAALFLFSFYSLLYLK